MKKIILVIAPLVLLAGCGNDKKNETAGLSQESQTISQSSDLSPRQSSSSDQSLTSSEQNESYPPLLEKFSQGDYSSFCGLYKSQKGENLVISNDNIAYYTTTGEGSGPVIVNNKTYKSRTDTSPFTQIYQFNKDNFEITFDSSGNKIDSIRITNKNGDDSIFYFVTKLDKNNFTEEGVRNYFKEILGEDASRYYLAAFKEKEFFVIKIIIKEWRDNGGSGTAGFCKIYPDGRYEMVPTYPSEK